MAGFSKKEESQFNPGGSLSTPKKREQVPADHFLMPTERKYPYKTSDGKISCNMLRAAISRAGQNGESEVESKARSLLKSHCGA